jgi:hypothetical protein
MFTLSSDVYGLIILLFIPLLWSIHTSLSHPHSKLVSDPIEVASEQEEPRQGAEQDSDSDVTTLTGNTSNSDKIFLPSTRASNLQLSKVLVIFEQSN